MAVEQVFAASPYNAAAQRVLAAPTQFYTTGEDNLRVVSVNSLVGVSLTLQGRFVDTRGKIGAARWDHTPNSDRTVKTSTYPLGVGAVLNLTVFAQAGAPLIGQCFVIVQLVRGLGSAAIVLGTLFSGYVTSQQGLAWPGSPVQSSFDGGGYVRTIVGSTPAAGSDILETVPTGARWELKTWRHTLTTSATVANRGCNLYIAVSGIPFGYAVSPAAIAASTFVGFGYGQGQPVAQDMVPQVYQVPLPIGNRLLAAMTINTTSTNLKPGDQYSAPRYIVEEWLEVN